MKVIRGLLLFSLLLIFPGTLLSQKEYLINTEDRFSLQSIQIDNNGDFISVFHEDSADYHHFGGLIKFDAWFNYSTYTHNIDTADVLLRDVIVTSDNNYLIAGTIGKDNGVYYSNHIIYFLLLDENFNFITENFFPLPELYTNPVVKMLKNTDGRIYVTLERAIPTGALKGVLELSSFAQVVKEMISYNIGGGIMNPFPSHGSGFFLLRGNPVPWAAGGITEVDTNLNFTDHILPYYINGQYYEMGTRGGCKWLNDTTYILISEGSSNTYGNDLYLYKLNNEHEFLTEPFIIGRENINDQSLNRRGIDWTDPEFIYVASWSWPGMNMANTYYAAVINENFEVLGAKSYGGNNNTAVSSMLATGNGSCIMVGSQRDYLAGDEFDWDGYVAFFQPDDIITSANETSNPYDSDYLLYPNPGQDELYIQTARKGVILKMYDQTGKLVLTYKFPNEFRNQIKTLQLKPGLYVCRLTDKDGNTEYKKWIKQ
nr:T9SS type A sorting domain-containing protein [Bacteroidota bacterium]